MNTTVSARLELNASPLMRFRAHLECDELAYQYDLARQRAVFYPRVIAPGSGNDALEWRISAGVGTVHAVTVIRPKHSPAYNVSLIDLAEGFRLMSRVEGVDADDVHIGMRVRFRTCRPDDGSAPYPVFDVEPTP